jgi:hypothetical protein
MARNPSSARLISPITGDVEPGFRSARKGVFRKEGGYWTVGYGGSTLRLKDSRGLGYGSSTEATGPPRFLEDLNSILTFRN